MSATARLKWHCEPQLRRHSPANRSPSLLRRQCSCVSTSKPFEIVSRRSGSKLGIFRGLPNRPRRAEVKRRLADGSLRIVGRHLLIAARGVSLKDLGLLIIDEEQRFGSADKTKLAALGHGAHVLTLTATPIPRTLGMANVGLRNLSVIATPPARRYPSKPSCGRLTTFQ